MSLSIRALAQRRHLSVSLAVHENLILRTVAPFRRHILTADAQTPYPRIFFKSRLYIGLIKVIRHYVHKYHNQQQRSLILHGSRLRVFTACEQNSTDRGVSLLCCRADRRGTQTVCSPADTANCSGSSRRGGTWSLWSGSGSGRWAPCLHGWACMFIFLIGCDVYIFLKPIISLQREDINWGGHVAEKLGGSV